MRYKIILLPIISIIVISVILNYNHIFSLKKYYKEHNKDIRDTYTKEQYNKIKDDVDNIINLIEHAKKTKFVTEMELEKRVLMRVGNMTMLHTPYMFILKLLDINDGDKFAKIIFYNNKPKAIGKIINDSKKDNDNKFFIKQVIKDIKEKGYSYVIYKHSKSDNKSINKKLTYFYYDKTLNWIITSSVFLDEVNSTIDERNNKLKLEIDEIIKSSIILTLIVSFLVGLISILFSRNITNQIAYTKDKLEEKVKEKTNLLNDLNENLEQRIIIEVEKNKTIQAQLYKSEKMASMGEMIGNIAHQWRQPLSVISTASTGIIMEKQFGLLNEDKLIDSCTTINMHAQYLSKTIDDFKNFIKGDRIKQDFNLKASVESFLNLVKGSIKNHNIKMILDIKEDIVMDGYENELIQCFMNIFNNAKDILKERLSENRIVFFKTEMINDKVVIKITDNAGGIPEKILPKIFDPYFTTKHKSQGTGLGLHMTYNLVVDGMNGNIEAKNVISHYEGKSYDGAEFKIELPLS